MSEWDEYDEAMDMAGLGFGFGIIIVAMCGFIALFVLQVLFGA